MSHERPHKNSHTGIAQPMMPRYNIYTEGTHHEYSIVYGMTSKPYLPAQSFWKASSGSLHGFLAKQVSSNKRWLYV